MSKFLAVCVSLLFAVFALADAHASPVNVDCGGQFQPKVSSVSGKAGPTTIAQLLTNGKPELISPKAANAGLSDQYNRFCSSTSQDLRKQCEQSNLQAAIDNAVENCKRRAIETGNDDTLYLCKKNTCKEGSIGCTKLATNAECEVLYPQLQCSCGVKKVLDQPTARLSTASCLCECTCTVDGSAEMQCTRCDGTCVESDHAA